MNHILWSLTSGVQTIICYIILPVWVYLARRMSTASKKAIHYIFFHYSRLCFSCIILILSGEIIITCLVLDSHSYLGCVGFEAIKGQIWSGWDHFQITPGKGGTSSWSNILCVEKIIWWKAVAFHGSFIRQHYIRKPEKWQTEKQKVNKCLNENASKLLFIWNMKPELLLNTMACVQNYDSIVWRQCQVILHQMGLNNCA